MQQTQSYSRPTLGQIYFMASFAITLFIAPLLPLRIVHTDGVLTLCAFTAVFVTIFFKRVDGMALAAPLALGAILTASIGGCLISICYFILDLRVSQATELLSLNVLLASYVTLGATLGAFTLAMIGTIGRVFKPHSVITKQSACLD